MSLQIRLSDFITAVGTDWKTNKTWLFGSLAGSLADLTTTNKTSFVAAINEVKAAATGAPPSATATAQGVVELATDAETLTGTDTTRATTPANVKAATDAVRSSIMGGLPTATLDTIKEIADAITNDESTLSALVTTVSGKQASNANLTAISGLVTAANKLNYWTAAGTAALTDLTAFGRTLIGSADAAAARTSIDVYSKAELGDPETVLATLYATAKT